MSRVLASRALALRALASLSLLAATGCLSTHHPVFGEHKHLAIGWYADWPSGAEAAAKTNRPVLLVGVSGKIDGVC